MKRRWITSLSIISIALTGIMLAHAAETPSVVKLEKKGNGFQLLRNGQPYFIKGAGGDGSKTNLKADGGDSWRTWGSDNLDGQLAEAQKLGMTVTVGIWLGHKEHGFHYDDQSAVAEQKERARQAILHYRNSPALILWALGNEMENGQEDNIAMWNAIEDIAKMAHQLDPNHPTMTVVAELGGDKIQQINAHCPDIDVIGINSYAGGASIADRYKAAGGIKPYVITEFGPPGTWESGKNAWGVVPELSSTEKAKWYRATYEKSVQNAPLCLGSYAFTWGNKQEATATWFGLLLSDGSKLGPVDALTQLWTGKSPVDPCPIIHSLAAVGPDQVAPDTTVQIALDVADPKQSPLSVTWVLQEDSQSYHTGGGKEASPPTYPDAIIASDTRSAKIRMPSSGGGYRLFAYVHNAKGSAAVANLPLFVEGGKAKVTTAASSTTIPTASMGQKATLPLAVSNETSYIAAGYMGNTGAIKMDEASTDAPHSGKTCLKVTYDANDNWGGVVWQSPANDWGDKPGGWNLTGAKKLTFWARGKQGGEVVTFQYGLLGQDKPYSDTASGKLDKVTLTNTWKQYTLSLDGKNLSRIKTGFCWVLAGSGHPVTFYLDDIRYE